MRIDAKTRKIVATIPVGGTPSALDLGYGSLWVANAANETVTRVDARTNEVLATIRSAGGRGP